MSHDIGEAFALRYYAMCINEDPDSKFGLTRYEATWDVLRWVHSLDCKHDREQIERIVAWLTDLAVEGDDAIRDAITCGALEHILEKPCYRPFFTHWARHPLLQSSHTAAMHWALAHETE